MVPSSQTEQRPRRGRPTEPLDQRIVRLADQSGDCWLWLGRLTRDGYAIVAVNSRPHLAHRVSYETFVGSIPDGLQIDHTCHNADKACAGGDSCPHRRCVNPAHLEPVTQGENQRRAARGVRRGGPELKSECIHGHAFDEENTHWLSGRRFCKACRRIRNRKFKADRRGERTTVDHAKVAARLRSKPGEWELVASPRSVDTASHTAHFIRTGKRLPSYRPAGSFEGEFRTVEGEFRVYARYVGTTRGAR